MPHHPSNIPSPPFPTLSTPVQEKEPLPTPIPSSPASSPEPPLYYLASLTERYDEKKVPDQEQGQSNRFNEFQEESCVEDVFVTVPRRDDTSMPYNTFRMWFLGIMFTMLISFINEIFYLQRNQLEFSPAVVIIISLPLGHFLARALPTCQYEIPLFPGSKRRFSFTLNPGPFSPKEHALILLMSTCSSMPAKAIDIIVMQDIHFQDKKPFIAGLLLVLSTQIIGLSFTGMFRRILIWPVQMVWPTALAPVSLLRSLHNYKEEESEEKGRMSRGNYYATVCLSSMAWYFIPGYFFPTVGVLSVICWLNPDNIILSQWTGSQGLGIGTISLDWSYCAYYIQPLITPWFAQVNVFIGFVVTIYILLPLAYYNNLWGAKKYPILSTDFYQTNGTLYSVEDVLNDKNVLDDGLYNSYGPLRMSAFFAISYGVMFACVAATIVHTVLYHGREIVARFKTRSGDRGDIHTKLMRAYPEVPDLWYLILFVACAVLSFITCVHYDYMPWWGLLLALAIAFVLVLPLGLVMAIVNLQVEFNVVPQYIFGYLLPGHPIANATFKMFSHYVNLRVLNLLGAQKIAHYMKIPPQIMFCTQLVAGVIGGTVNLATATWLMKTRISICQPEGYPFSCVYPNLTYRTSIIWGLIGPARVFGSKDGAMYGAVLWGFVIGALLPLITWIIRRRFPNVSWLRLVHWPALLSATALMPPALPYMYINGHFLGFVFAFVLRRYQFRWWARYNYLTSAALDTGLALSGLIIYIFFQSTGQDMVRWWGNPIQKDHCPLATAALE